MTQTTKDVYHQLAQAAPALPVPVLVALTRLVLSGRPFRLDVELGGTLLLLSVIPPVPLPNGGRAGA
jgi:hypothetical protein